MPAGRPKKKLDTRQIEKLAAIGCIDEEIAVVMGCSVDTLTRNFADTLKSGRTACKVSLRRKQFALAMRGDRTMLVWLGKNLLGQSDKTDVTSGGDPIRFNPITLEGGKVASV